MAHKPVFVTKPFLPPLDEFIPYLESIWESDILTNNGPFHQQFETELSNYLGVEHISLFANGTLALVTAIQALELSGEVITTPFSFVATAHSLIWNKVNPVFVDIDPHSFTLDPSRIEEAITPETSAIIPVHVYGYPCNVDEIKRIADKHGLKVIYDAAHAFGVKLHGKSILNYGDMSVLSFHATKAYNTIEGGAIISKDKNAKRRIDHLKNFGFENEVTVIGPGINAKMNEVQSAFGLLQLKYIDKVFKKRHEIYTRYKEGLADIKGITIPKTHAGTNHSYSYFPVLIDPVSYGESRDSLYERMKREEIYCRRYFYPLISQFPTYCNLKSSQTENLPVATRISKNILCLPFYPTLENIEVSRIIDLIRKD